MIKNFEELAQLHTQYTSALKAKFIGRDGKRHIILCGGTGCISSKSNEIAAEFEKLIAEKNLGDKVTVNQAGCFGFCSQGPFVKIYPENTLYRLVTVKDVAEIVEKDVEKGEIVERLLYVDPNTGKTSIKQDDIPFYKKQVRIALYGCANINPEDLNESLGAGAFKGFAKALQTDRADVIREILESGLRGRGGGGFSTGEKWRIAYEQPEKEKYVVCNDAFIDRSILEGNPIAVLEGMMIAGYAIGAQIGYFYVRAEYPVLLKRLKLAIEQTETLGLLGDHILGTDFSFRIYIRVGAGSFVCGEETALLNSIEGKRGTPRPRPPFPAVKGLWGKPTLVNNVETLACVPYILRNGKDAFTKYGTENSKGTKVFSLGGKINNVGLAEIPMGTTLRELIYDIGDGIPGNKKFKAIQTGGPSGGCLTEADLDMPIDFDNLVAKGSMMGSGAAIVMDEDNCMVDVAKFYMEFICDESCGKCTSCRIGTKRMLEILTRITEGKATMDDLAQLEELAENVKSSSFCGLGQSSPNLVLSTLKHFREEYVAHIVDKKCPAHVCKNLMEYQVESNKCFGCGLCARACPVSALVKTDYVAPGKKLPAYAIDQEKCVKCGMCIASCKFKAIVKK